MMKDRQRDIKAETEHEADDQGDEQRMIDKSEKKIK